MNHTATPLPASGYIRPAQLLKSFLPVSPATLWRWVKIGRFPQPKKLGPKVSAWDVADIRNWLEENVNNAGK